MPTIGAYTYSEIADSASAADAGHKTDTLWDKVRVNLEFLKLWLGGDFVSGAVANHDHDGVNSAAIPGADGGTGIAVGHFTKQVTASDQNGVNVCNFKPDAVLITSTDQAVTAHTQNANTYITSTGDSDGYAAVFGVSDGSNTGHGDANIHRALGGLSLEATSSTVNDGNRGAVLCLKNLAGLVDVGTYSGNGAGTQAITGVGFQPVLIIVYEGGSHTDNNKHPFVKTPDMATNQAREMDATGTNNTTAISIDADGFTVRTSELNTSSKTYCYVCIGEGSVAGQQVVHYTQELSAISSFPHAITGVGFMADMVIAVYTGANTGADHFLIATRNMGLDRTHYSFQTVSGTRLFTDYIGSIDEDGCTMGSSPSCNMGTAGTPSVGEAWDFFFIKSGSALAFSAM